MKKIFALPILAIGLMASQSLAEICKISGKTAACEYTTPVGCYSMSTENSNSVEGVCTKPNCTCEQLITACKKDGALYSFASDPTMWSSSPWGGGQTCSGNNGTLEYSAGCGKYCKWATGCTEIKINSEFATCELAVANCEANAPMYSDAACNTWVGGRDPNRTALGCCLWSGTETNCHTIWSDETGASGKVDNCKTGANKFWNGECTSSGNSCPSSPPIYPAASSSSSAGGSTTSSSSGGTDPIISYNKAPVVGLNVVSFARNLQIASGKDATVALFDMHGKQVFSQKVLSGTTTISLEKQKQGVYYAVVKSGSQKQTVKVVLK